MREFLIKSVKKKKKEKKSQENLGFLNFQEQVNTT